jgi:hypothetical protein
MFLMSVAVHVRFHGVKESRTVELADKWETSAARPGSAVEGRLIA